MKAHADLQRAGYHGAFWRHFFEMLAVMVVGMLVGGAALVFGFGLTSWDAVTVTHPIWALGVMAAGMSMPMFAWMLHRGMGVRNAIEMSAAMIVPVIPFMCLVWWHVTDGAQCGAYCAITVVTMLALMYARREQYSMHHSRAR